MNSKPILFSASMVRAILNGSKTQTRRILKIPTPDADDQHADLDRAWLDNSYLKPELGNVPCLKVPYGPQGGDLSTVQRFFPPHAPGDELWVKETWRTTGDGGRCDRMPPRDLQPHPVWYEADGKAPSDLCTGKTRVSIFMMKWASRITLTITDVRIQRLQDISDEDAIAEGIGTADGAYRSYCKELSRCVSPVTSYRTLWDSINGPNAWATNHFVAAYSFTVKKP